MFRKAIAAATATESASKLARVQVRMVSALAERLDAAHLGALAPDVRQNVVRAGDPHLTAYFYVTQSRIAARAGAIDEAWRHLDLAAALLPVEPNHLLDALHAFASAALCSVGCRYTDAVYHGRRALSPRARRRLRAADPARPGQPRPRAAAPGSPPRGRDPAGRGPRDAGVGAETEIAQLDSKAQLRLLERDMDGLP